MTFITSTNNRFSVFYNYDEDKFYSESQKRISGNIYLKEENNLLWIKNFENPINAAVSDNGRVALLHKRQTDYSKFSSSANPKESIDLGGTLTAFENDGQQIFTYNFDSNLEGCSISSDGKLISVSTLFPDNSIYCFDLQNRNLLWKYKNHSRKVILKLQFNNKNNIVVFTGSNTSTTEKEYVMQLDGNLEPSYAHVVNNLNKIKKQPPEQKVESLIAMVDSGERDKIIEGIALLKTFVTTKGSFPYHSRIIEILSKFIQTEDNGIFDNLWIVLKSILKNQPQIIEPLIPKILLRFKKLGKEDGNTLRYLGDLGKVNPQWIINEIPLIKQMFVASKDWNERITALFAIGYIGSVDVNLVKELIPAMVEYISDLGKIIKELNSITKNNIQNPFDIIVVNPSNIDSVNWLRDACIDVIGQIGKKYPESVKIAIPELERLSNYAISPYTNKKAKKALIEINGK